jgi:ABC-2 type transport system ATP-binding protein
MPAVETVGSGGAPATRAAVEREHSSKTLGSAIATLRDMAAMSGRNATIEPSTARQRGWRRSGCPRRDAAVPRSGRGRRAAVNAVEAEGLVKRYGSELALAGVDLEVPAGSVTALLGPNGAGKSTTVRILTTLAVPDEGRATVGGFDVVGQGNEVRRRIGLAAQDATVDPLLTGRENLVMIGELHQLSRRAAKARAVGLLEQFALSDAADRVTSKYSGGMRRRLDLAAALVADPQVLFLDEPTTGLDPRARGELWTALDTLVDNGTTVLVTTQYLEEAERLADDIVVVDRGRVIAQGDARKLKSYVGGDHLHVVVTERAQMADAAALLTTVAGAQAAAEAETRTLTAPTNDGVASIVELAAAMAAAGIAVEDLGLRQPSLNEVFLTLTGSMPDGVDATNHERNDP